MGAALRERKRPKEEAEERDPPGVASEMRGVHGHDCSCAAAASSEPLDDASSAVQPPAARSSLRRPFFCSSLNLHANIPLPSTRKPFCKDCHTGCHALALRARIAESEHLLKTTQKCLADPEGNSVAFYWSLCHTAALCQEFVQVSRVFMGSIMSSMTLKVMNIAGILTYTVPFCRDVLLLTHVPKAF